MSWADKLSGADAGNDETRGFSTMSAYRGLLGMMPTEAGVEVTHQRAMMISAVWRAVQLITDAVVGLPYAVRDDEGAVVDDHPTAKLLANSGSANDWMSAVSFKSAVMSNVALHGNGYAFIGRDGDNTPTGLFPIPSSHCTPRFINGALYYVATMGDKQSTVNAYDILHVQGPLTLDGVNALSPVEYARQTIGLSIALERFAAKFFGQGGNIGGIIETPPMKKDQRDAFIREWKETYTGPDSAFKIAALPAGMKFHRTTADPQESQALESRVHQVREVARIWGVPPHMLGDLEKVSYASVEMQNIEFYQGTISPYVVRWEAEIARKLLSTPDVGRLKICFDMDAKLRGTTKERYDAYGAAINAGIMTRNEARKKENLPPLPGGDQLTIPVNVIGIGDGAGSGGDANKGNTKAPPPAQGGT